MMAEHPAPAGNHEELLATQRRIWTIGDYPAVARQLLPVSEALVGAVGLGGDADVLDVGVGNGNTAVLAAKAGARVVGVDITPAQLEHARARCRAEGVDVDLREADAEALPFDDGSFDFVVSVFGVIFAPGATRATEELARVCRPGGTVAMTAWLQGGWSGRFWSRVPHLAPPPVPGAARPEEWGDASIATGRFRAAGLEPSVEERPFYWEYGSVEEARSFLLRASGPFMAVREHAAMTGRADEVDAALGDAFAEANEAVDGTCRVPAPWLLVVGRRAA